MNQLRTTGNAGFSLIEVMIVAALLSLMTLVAATTLVQGQKVTGQSVVLADIEDTLHKVLQRMVREIPQGSVQDAATPGSEKMLLLGTSGDYSGIAFRKVTGVDASGDLTFDTQYTHFAYNDEDDTIEWWEAATADGVPTNAGGKVAIAANIKDLNIAWADDATSAAYVGDRRLLLTVEGERTLNDGSVYTTTVSSSMFIMN